MLQNNTEAVHFNILLKDNGPKCNRLCTASASNNCPKQHMGISIS